ncbi:glucosylceramidase [Granulicella pectinivorans]|uniref:Glucosylceramidase n=1 Tax=Granulicella pectinivorans TaxID=474950 RepID=A0A1I6MXZ6_9BACT|nr:glycoside hydrolase family 30 beta sandwich domain-containing protein [Granulicella pectinivorans]SFS20534.1 glucosylceramidase [Granulicella pectinivorans]
MNPARIVFAVLSLSAFALPAAAQQATVWLTTPDRTSLLAEQPQRLAFAKSKAPGILVDDKTKFQTMDGFGYALTGGSAQLMMKMSPAARTALIQELFGNGPADVGTSYLRVTVGASDMNDHVYTYDDMPDGETDPDLKHFSLAPDEADVIPVLKEILKVTPKIKILASPWTAPSWMKDNNNAKGGSLKHEYYGAYATYWVKYLLGMQAAGIPIDALTPQNEPENPKNTPSMVVTSEQEADFIGNYLGPALEKAGLHTKIISFDHNCDNPNYSIDLLKNPAAAKYTNGSGYHLYRGEITAMTTTHNAFPNKNLYFTEQMVIARKNDTGLQLAKPVARLIIGAPQNWSRNVLLWNLAADPQNGPHTASGGCPICTGAITLDGDKITRNIAFYTASQASKFVPPGSVRIASTGPADALPHVAFLTPKKKHVLIVSNTTDQVSTFVFGAKGKSATATLPAGAVATYVW